MPGEKPRAVLQFNEYDFRHRKVLKSFVSGHAIKQSWSSMQFSTT